MHGVVAHLPHGHCLLAEPVHQVLQLAHLRSLHAHRVLVALREELPLLQGSDAGVGGQGSDAGVGGTGRQGEGIIQAGQCRSPAEQ